MMNLNSENFELNLGSLYQNSCFMVAADEVFNKKSKNWYYHDKIQSEGKINQKCNTAI